MSSNQDTSTLSLNWTVTDDLTRSKLQHCMKRTNWNAICEIGSRAYMSYTCIARPEFTGGGSSLSRLLEFEDGTLWVARVQLAKSTPQSSCRATTDFDTMDFLRSHTNAPVPRVFASEADDQNTSGVPFMLLQFLPGNTAYDESRLYSDGALVPHQFQETFYSSVAAAHVQIASARLPQIGTVVRDSDGNFTVGPIPGIGGPFDTASSFIQAWTSRLEFPNDEKFIRGYVATSRIDEVLRGIYELPDRVANLAATGKYFTSEGPFPIRHPDLYLSNIVVTKTFQVLGVIDWEGAHTVPWELIDAPRFLTTVPRHINPAGMYHEGKPLDHNEASMWKDREAYAAMVRQAEQAQGADNKLSSILADDDLQDLASTLHLFAEGKLGFYGQALDYFENKEP